MKLYEMGTEHVPELRHHPEFKAQAPDPVGIAGSGVFRFKGTNVYSWYVHNRSAFWVPHGEPVVLKPSQVGKFIRGLGRELERN